MLKSNSESIARLQATVELVAKDKTGPISKVDLFWQLVYADRALLYIKENHPEIYKECGDDLVERSKVIKQADYLKRKQK
jgi:hypothetical protein